MKINYSRQNIDKNDIKLVIKSLNSDLITQGNFVKKFEKDLKNYFNAKYAFAVSNGTAALYIGCKSLGWSKNDIIITTPNTFIASANAIESVGGITELVDINELDNCIDPNKLENKIINLRKKNKLVRGLIAVDYAGQPCDWESIRYLANKYEFQVINDNCHSMGAKYNSSLGYASKYADLVCQSYHPVKNITTGEGGSILTNKKDISDKVNILRSHGIERNRSNFRKKKNVPNWYYEVQDLSLNFRISDINCALGISQLKKLNKFVKIRKKIASIYDDTLRNIDYIHTPKKISNTSHAYHLYPLRINFKKLKLNKIKFFNYFFKSGFKLQVHYIPIYKHPYYKDKYKFKENDFPNTNKFYDDVFSIPNYVGLKKKEQLKFIRLLKKYVQK